MHLGIASLHDPEDPRGWSGSVYYMMAALKPHHRLSWLGPPAGPARRRRFAIKVRRRLARWLGGRRTVTEHDRAFARALAAGFDARARDRAPDLLFAPAGSIGVGDLRDGRPLVYLSDATFAAMDGYYPEFSRLSAKNRADGEALERSAIARADACVFASEWAAASARGHYGADPAKIHVLPFGANIDSAPDPATLKYARDDRLRLAFIGVDWARKGGGIALAALAALRARGLPATLTVVGCTPPPGVDAPGLTVIPHLNKRRPAEAEQFDRLLREADFLLVPTRYEAIGVVYCEAAAYATPSAATDTGGVASHVEEGVNGFRLPPEAGGEAYAERMAALWEDADGYAALRRASRAKFDRDLNWPVWAERMDPIFAGVRRR